ncbi:MAG TPA: hypothetical protein VHM70_25690 [Polyangiaceae bacterium]|jgi:hypothetical protein|nr:hypothetical protein [Polyangiaceae bacterium]
MLNRNSLLVFTRCDINSLLRSMSLGALVSAAAFGCSDTATGEQVATPYKPDDAVVIGGEELGGEQTRLSTACEEHDCGTFEDACGDRAAGDVILDQSGNVVDVICYKQDVNVDDVPVDSVQQSDAKNNTVLVLDGEDDGLDVEKDVTISGNNAVIYGSGPDVSVIGGTVDIQKNNAVVRGVRIKKDVTITKNNSKLAFCVIEGDLTISGNNTTVAECTVLGKVTITGVNTVFVEDRLVQTTLSGKNLTCNHDTIVELEADGGVAGDGDAGSLGEVQCTSSGDETPKPEADGDAGAASGGKKLK